MSIIMRLLGLRKPYTKLQACWMEQGAMMKFCGMTQFDNDATVAKWQRKGYGLCN